MDVGPDLTGVVFAGRYRLWQMIGRGGMGEVWQARDDVLRRDVAVKVLPAGSSTMSVRRFEREAEMLARLQHPGIAVVHDAGRQDDRLFIVMELLRGRDLAKVVAEHPEGLPSARVVDLFQQIADALVTAHGLGVVHRDLKPANVFVQSGDRTKICDFGIARTSDLSDTLTTTGVVLGTLTYMSPEQCRGERDGAPSDLYSLGVLVFELLTGRPPFAPGQPPYALMRQHAEEEPPRLSTLRPGIPEALDRVVTELLAKDPADRPDGHALVRALDGMATDSAAAGFPGDAPDGDTAEPEDDGAAVPPTLPRRPLTRVLPTRRLPGPLRRVRWTRSRKLFAGASVLCVTALVVVAANLFPTGPSGPPPLRALHTDHAIEVSFSPGGKMLAAGGNQSPVLRWDARTGRRLGEPLTQQGNAYNVVFSPDGETLAASTLHYQGTVRLWDPRTGKLASECAVPGVVDMEFSPDGAMLAMASQEQEDVGLYDPRSGELIRELGGIDNAKTLSFSPDGDTLVTGARNGTVRRWDPKTGEEKGSHFTAGDGEITSLDFSPKGGMLATASPDGEVRRWDPSTGSEIGQPLTSEDDEAAEVMFSPDGSLLATGQNDGTVRFWDPGTGEQTGDSLSVDGEGVMHMDFSPDGRRLATVAGGGTVELWKAPSAKSG
ncbi:protein kinase domain-containing protein [Streptomyces sp. NBC_01187]|uniref:WD40 repeat domain-containing serine/threonine protein kinase n=1 Tax=Streptomyces sp. NBC_01187 TaxID=2903766 RepID=UPI002F9198E7|nr:protein kinase [Streptomyces sp. NBC_01187]